MDRRLTDIGAELVAARDLKRATFADALRTALTGPGDAVDVVREYLRYELLEQSLTVRLLKAITPRSTPAEQLELPGCQPARPAPKGVVQKPLVAAQAAIARRKAALYASIIRTALAGSPAAEETLREFLRHETRQHKMAMKLLLLMTPRAASSIPRQVVEVLDEKPDKIFSLSQLERILVTRPENQGSANLRNAVRQACHDLAKRGAVRRISQGLFQSSLGSKPE